jgi:hypothetical protein
MPIKPWLVVLRPQNRLDSVGAHLPAALLTGAMLIASAILPIRGLPGPTCLFLRLTGYPCPFCGSTRTFIAMGHGRWHEAWHQSPLATVLFAGTVGVFLWNIAALATGIIIKPGEAANLTTKTRWWLAGALVSALAANWFYRIVNGLK